MKLIKMILIALLSLSVVFGLCACGAEEGKTDDKDVISSGSEQEDKENESSEEEKTEAFEVKVVNSAGEPVSGVMVQLCKDSCVPAKTNDNGIATFNFEITDGYKLSVMSCPAGYQYTGEAEIYLESGSTEYTIELSEAQ